MRVKKRGKMKNCYVYARLSADEQATDGYSLGNKKGACREYAVNKGGKIFRQIIKFGKEVKNEKLLRLYQSVN